MLGRSLLITAFALISACDRVPEQALRDEQSRSRKYRGAFESEHEENTALRTRLELAEAKLRDAEKKKCAPDTAAIDASAASPAAAPK